MKRRAYWSIVSAVLFVIVARGSSAFAVEFENPVDWYAYGGYSQTIGTTADYMNSGWGIGGGAIWHPNLKGAFSLRLGLSYDDWGASNKLLSLAQTQDVQIDSGRGSVWALTADVLWEFGSPNMHGYIGLGIGGYSRYVQLSNTVYVPGYICDPWWGNCWTTTVPGEVVQASDKLTKFGANATIGMTFPLSHGALYLEARYHWIDTPEATEYIPISVGYRF